MLPWLVACALTASPDAALRDAPGWPAPQAAVPLAPQGTAPPAPVATNSAKVLPRKGAAQRSTLLGGRTRGAGSARSQQEVLVTTGASLGVVLGLFFLVAWFVRGRGAQRGVALPNEAVETLGRFNLGSRQQAHLVRCGSKLLLVAVSPTSVETLTEITDPREVNHLLAICQRSSPHGASAAFREVLERLGRERAPLA